MVPVFRVTHAWWVAMALAALATACASSSGSPAEGTSGTAPAAKAGPTAKGSSSEGDDDDGPASDDDDSPPTTPSSTHGAGGAKIVAEVERELGLLQETHYQHTTHVVEADGVFDLDCSGFADYVLTRSAPTLFSSLSNATAAANATRARPLAEDYVSFFGGSPSATSGWTSVAKVADLALGDIVAWLEPPSAADTGHVMVVREAVRARDATSFIVPVWDSVELPHGSTDSRTATNATGIGTGEVVLFVDANGAPTAHEWSDGSAKVVQKTTMGRAR